MQDQIESFINGLADECLGIERFKSFSEDDRMQAREAILSQLYQSAFDVLLDNFSKEDLDQLEKVDFEAEEGPSKLAELTGRLPSYVFIKVGDKLRQEIETIKQTGQIPGFTPAPKANSW